MRSLRTEYEHNSNTCSSQQLVFRNTTIAIMVLVATDNLLSLNLFNPVLKLSRLVVLPVSCGSKFQGLSMGCLKKYLLFFSLNLPSFSSSIIREEEKLLFIHILHAMYNFTNFYLVISYLPFLKTNPTSSTSGNNCSQQLQNGAL